MAQIENYIVYLILGDDDVVLYVGMTKWKLRRLTQQHFTRKGHLDPACYRDAAGIRFAECVSEEDAAAREKYLIKTLNPRYNGTHNKPGKFSFFIPFDWKCLPVDKSRLNAPLVHRRRRTMANLEIPSFDILKENLGTLLSFDCSQSRIEGPDPALTWLDGEKLGEIVDTAWTECGSPGPLYLNHGANFACEALSHDDWVGYTEYDRGFDDVELRTGEPIVGLWGTHGNRVLWLTARDNHAVRDELVGFVQPWQTRVGLRSLVGTFATDLDVSVRLYNWRDKYFLTLAYLRELLQAGAKVGDRYLLLTCNLNELLHDWFLHQSKAVGYNVAVSGVDVRPGQRAPLTITSNGKRNEVECRWHQEALSAGRGAARRLNQTVWVYRLPEILELQIALDVELKRLLEGAVDVCYHDEQFKFQNYYQIVPLARSVAPKPFVLN